VPELDSREEPISTNKKIRTDYVPKGIMCYITLVGKFGAAEPTQICPRCGIAVKVSEMEEHVRIELLDPKWRQQKAVYESRLKGSNLVLGKQDISMNLSRLSDHRSDIFGSDASEDSKKLIEHEKKMSAEKSKNTWDGTASSAPKALKKAQSNVSTSPDKIIGPQIPLIPPIPGSKIIVNFPI
jgi:splicing factor 3A subunit 1